MVNTNKSCRGIPGLEPALVASLAAGLVPSYICIVLYHHEKSGSALDWIR